MAKVLWTMAAIALAWWAVPAWSADFTLYRQAGCSCCGKWARHLEAAGHKVTIIEGADMTVIRRKAGVPEALQSCHVAEVDGYVIEGHVPVADIERMLAERPAITGLAVAGMPIGSPGMEMEGVEPEAYEVMEFDSKGASRVYARH